jgi:hypothetical protein
MSPFANLFNKQIGNIAERYRISDAASEGLFEQLSELKRPLTSLAAHRFAQERKFNLIFHLLTKLS